MNTRNNTVEQIRAQLEKTVDAYVSTKSYTKSFTLTEEQKEANKTVLAELRPIESELETLEIELKGMSELVDMLGDDVPKPVAAKLAEAESRRDELADNRASLRSQLYRSGKERVEPTDDAVNEALDTLLQVMTLADIVNTAASKQNNMLNNSLKSKGADDMQIKLPKSSDLEDAFDE